MCNRRQALPMTVPEQKALLERQDEMKRLGKWQMVSSLANGSSDPFYSVIRPFLIDRNYERLTPGNIACFLASADELFVLACGSDIASALHASSSASWLITGYNLGYVLALPIVSSHFLSFEELAKHYSTGKYAI